MRISPWQPRNWAWYILNYCIMAKIILHSQWGHRSSGGDTEVNFWHSRKIQPPTHKSWRMSISHQGFLTGLRKVERMSRNMKFRSRCVSILQAVEPHNPTFYTQSNQSWNVRDQYIICTWVWGPWNHHRGEYPCQGGYGQIYTIWPHFPPYLENHLLATVFLVSHGSNHL